MISPATSTVKSPELKSISVPSIVMLSTTTPAFEVVTPDTARVELTVAAPVTARVEPSNCKFASAFTPPDPVPVTIRLLPSFVNDHVAAVQENVPDPSVVNCVPALPSAVGNTYATEAVLLPALKPV